MRVGMAMIAAGLAGLAGGAEAQAITFGLKPGQTVRVRTVDGARFVTRLAPVPGPSPTALFERAETPFFLDRVDSLWVRGRAVRTGAIVGAAIATPAGFAFFAHFCSVFSDGSGCQEWGKVTVFAAGGDTPKVLHQSEFKERIAATPALVENNIYIRTPTALYAFGK